MVCIPTATAVRGKRTAVRYNGIVSITILLFASVADAVGVRRLEVETCAGDTVAAVRDRLVACHPALERFVPNLLYALDEEYVKEHELIRPGATLALIPPVSGG